MRLNLGCGLDVKDGWENYDGYNTDERVKILNLNKLPLPFKDNSVDYVLLSHVLEHLDVNRYDFIRDIHRILKPRGIAEIRVPVFNDCLVHTKSFFPMSYFNCVCKDKSRKYPTYRDFVFEMVERKRICKTFFSKFFLIFPFLENIVPSMCHGEIVWKLRKIINLDDMWVCNNCDAVNPVSKRKCWICHKKRDKIERHKT